MTRNEFTQAKKMMDRYNQFIKVVKDHDAKCDVIFDQLEQEGVDYFCEKGERIAAARLYALGLTDEFGYSDLHTRLCDMRKELATYIIDHVSGNMISKADREALKRGMSANVTYQFRVIDAAKKLLQA